MQRRTATVVCTEETEFVVLDRRGNGRAVYRALLAEHKQKCKFLKFVYSNKLTSFHFSLKLFSSSIAQVKDE